MKKNLKNNLWLFYGIFILLNTVFLYYTLHFFIGNHDWDWVKGTTQVLSLTTGMFEARFAKFILNIILYSGQIFPVLNTITSFALLALGTVLLIKYFKIINPFVGFLVSSIAVTQPYILGWLYFPINVLGNFSAVVLVIGGLILSEKKSIIYNILAVLSFIVALGVYPSVVEMMLVLFAIKHIISPLNNKLIAKSFINIISSIILFKVLLLIFAHFNLIVSDYYNLKTSNISDILPNIHQYIKLFIEQLWLTIPFISKSLKIISLLGVLVAVLVTSNCLRNVLLWIMALSSTVLTAVLTTNIDEVAFQPRVNFYGLGFLYVGAFTICMLNYRKIIKNIGYILSISYLFLSIHEDLYAQKVWFLGKRAETNLVMRMVHHIEEKSTALPLIPILTDEISLRARFYNQKYDKKSPYLLNRSFVVRHIPSGMFNFYTPNDIFYTSSQISTINNDLYRYLTTTSSIWPQKDSIYIDDIYAIIISTNTGLKAIRSQLPK